MCNIRKNMAINFKKHIIPFAFILFLTACSSTKYVPDGEYLLDEIKILTDNKEVKASELSSYVRQKPNNKWFNIFKTQLHIYSLLFHRQVQVLHLVLQWNQCLHSRKQLF